MNSWLKQWKSQVIIWVCVKLSCFARHQCTIRLSSSVKGALCLSLGQESYCSRPGPFTFHVSEIGLNCVFAFSSRHTFRQWWEVRRQDPDSSYIVLYRHTTCPEAMEKKKTTSWVQRRYFKRFNLSTEIVSMLWKTVIVHKENGNKCTVLEKASFAAAKSEGHKLQPYFLARLSWTSLTKVFLVRYLCSASAIQIEEITIYFFLWKVQIFRYCIWMKKHLNEKQKYEKAKWNSNALASNCYDEKEQNFRVLLAYFTPEISFKCSISVNMSY